MDLFDENENILSFEDFYNFPIPFKEFQQVIKVISNGLVHLMKTHFQDWRNETSLANSWWYQTIPVIIKILQYLG